VKLVLQRVCVFAGSNAGTVPAFAAAAADLGAGLAAARIGIVYGGGNVGLMGVVADAALAAGGEVVGVIPDFLLAKELGHTGVTSLEVVASMHERKARMAELAGGFVALPGGFGTFDELFEILTWGQLGLHAKPIVALDVAGYYEPLLLLADRAVEAGFLRPAHRRLLRHAADVPGVVAALHEPVTVTAGKWLDRPEQV
jgi:uncharacterized protein (TIGR00730 family)